MLPGREEGADRGRRRCCGRFAAAPWARGAIRGPGAFPGGASGRPRGFPASGRRAGRYRAREGRGSPAAPAAGASSRAAGLCRGGGIQAVFDQGACAGRRSSGAGLVPAGRGSESTPGKRAQRRQLGLGGLTGRRGGLGLGAALTLPCDGSLLSRRGRRGKAQRGRSGAAAGSFLGRSPYLMGGRPLSLGFPWPPRGSFARSLRLPARSACPPGKPGRGRDPDGFAPGGGAPKQESGAAGVSACRNEGR